MPSKLAALICLMPLLGPPAQAAENSGALWNVQQLCTTNQSILGLPFPCIEVNLTDGYSVLRPPFGKSDTILVPIIRSSGVEDAALRDANAPNYFALAWKARTALAGKTSRNLAFNDVGLAINSSITRSQDQMHIHIECLASDVKQALERLEPSVPAKGWGQLKQPIRHLTFWGQRLAAETLASSNPFALVAQGIADARQNMGSYTIVLAGIRSKSGKSSFLLLAANTRQAGNGPARSTGEDLLDHGCSP